MKVYIVIETADVEIIAVRAYLSKENAEMDFADCALENRVNEVDPDLRTEALAREAAGTVMLAGDDSYAVQLIETETGDRT